MIALFSIYHHVGWVGYCTINRSIGVLKKSRIANGIYERCAIFELDPICNKYIEIASYVDYYNSNNLGYGFIYLFIRSDFRF